MTARTSGDHVGPDRDNIERVLLSHEWLVTYAGSERCVEQFRQEFPSARLLTTVFEPSRLPNAFAGAEPSFLQRIPGATSHHEWLLPLMPLSWRLRRRVDDVDVVISSSHACARAVRVGPSVAHVSYTHAPMRYAWEFDLEKDRFPAWTHPIVRPMMAAFRRWDRRKAQGVDILCANSRDIADRIRACYGREARVIHPPVDTEFFTPGETPRGDHFLFAGRFVAYKRPDLVVEAFREMPDRKLRMIGTGPMEEHLRGRATPNIEFLGSVSDERLREEYRRARAMIFCAHEDFGIVMAEAQSCGTPVIALARGGAMDIVDPGVTGWLITEQDPALLRDTVRTAATTDLDHAAISGGAQRFSRARYRRQMREIVEEAVAAKRTRHQRQLHTATGGS